MIDTPPAQGDETPALVDASHEWVADDFNPGRAAHRPSTDAAAPDIPEPQPFEQWASH